MERQPTAGRGVVTILGLLVIAAGLFWGALGLSLLSGDVCAASHPGRTAECEVPLVWQVVRSFVSAGIGGCAILVAAMARTRAMVWKGGIVLVLAGVFVSPIVVP